MTLVRVYRRETIYSLSVRGHAVGRSEVCAAASELCNALAGFLEQDEESETLLLALEPGSATLAARCGSRAEGAFEMAILGFRQLEEYAPEAVSVRLFTESSQFFERESNEISI